MIYQIELVGGSRTYIGSAVNLPQRRRSHMHLLRHGKHHCRALQNAFLKYGEVAVRWIVLETVERASDLIIREQAWLDQFAGKLYNKSPTAGSRLGSTMSPEARAKISASLKGNQYRKGKPFPPEHRAIISAAVKAAYADGRRKVSLQPQNLAAYNASYQNGEILHPRTNLTRELEIISDYLITKNMTATGCNFGVTGGAINYILKKNNVAKFKRTNYAKLHCNRH